jgi:neutral ceramidase
MTASNFTEISGPIGSAHTFIDISNTTVSAEFTTTGAPAKTCTGALGDSFAGGTTDGPGAFDFKQGTNGTGNPVWNWLGQFLGKPSKEMKECQLPKPILLAVGITSFPAPWSASVVPLQILKLGPFYIVGWPGEPTTMAGRRLRQTVKEVLIGRNKNDQKKVDPIVVISGLSNEYTHYITTFEEYQHQRYEGASVLYGPHTLAAYQQEFAKLAASLRDDDPLPPVPPPPFEGKTFNLMPNVLLDRHPSDKGFGAVELDAKPTYRISDKPTVVVEFWGGNPRNDHMIGKTFLTIEKKQSNGNFQVVLTDNDWETKFKWRRGGFAESILTVEWDISSSALEDLPGTYIIRHFGFYKVITGTVHPYSGQSRIFVVQ